MTIKKLIPCTLTAAVLASAALTGCSSKGTSDKSTTSAKTSAQETKGDCHKSLSRPRILRQAAAKVKYKRRGKRARKNQRRPRLSLEAKEVSTENRNRRVSR